MKIFFFDPTCLPYRIHLYEYFIKQFQKEGYKLEIYYDSKQTHIDKPGFRSVKYSFISFLKLHIREKPDISIFFIWLRYKFSLFFLIFCRLILSTKLIVWCKGINVSKPNQPIMNQLYYLRQRIAHALILYSENDKKFIITKKEKVFVAHNTLNFKSYPKVNNSKEKLKIKYGVNQPYIVLFVGRIEPRKKLDQLISAFDSPIKDTGLIIVGPDMPQELLNNIKGRDDIYYKGAIFDQKIVAEIFSMSDLFCIPGHIGLGINQAFYHSLPVITTNVKHSSEFFNLFRNDENGILVEKDDIKGIRDSITFLLNNKSVYKKYSSSAKKYVNKYGDTDKMLNKFKKAAEYVLQ